MTSQFGIRQSSSKQWVAGLAAASIMFNPSYDISWVFGPEDDLPSFTITMMNIGLVIIGAILGAVLADTFGRKRTLLATLIFVIPRLCCIIFEETEWVWIIQIFTELGSGITCTVVPLYICEIASSKNRGSLMVLQLAVYSIGLIPAAIVLLISVHYDFNKTLYVAVSSILLLISALFHAITLALFPETPHYLHSKKQYHEAAKSLAFYRGISYVKIREDASALPLNSYANTKRRGKICDMMQFENRRSIAMIFSLIVTRWISGQYRNNLMIFTWAYSIDETIYALLGTYGAKVMCAIFILFAIGILQRKLALMLVIFLCLVAAIIGSGYFRLYSAVILVVLLVQHFCHIILVGVGLAYAGEFFSTHVRAIAIAVIISFEILIRNIFLITEYTFGAFVTNRDYAPLPLFFSGVALIFAFFFVLIFFPKTNNSRNFDIPIESPTGEEYLS